MHKRRANVRRKGMETTYMRLDICRIYDGNRCVADASITLLAASIEKHGLLQPVVVRKHAYTDMYSLVCGFRRIRACRLIGWTQVDAIVLHCCEQEAAACFMEEHLTREEPRILEEAWMIKRHGEEAISAYFALPEKLIQERIHLLALPDCVRDVIDRNHLTLAQVKPLLDIHDPVRQLEAALIIAQRELNGKQARRLIYGDGYEDYR